MFCTIDRLARTVVPSSLIRIWPALTLSPSLTSTSSTMPPVRCWIFLTLFSTTTVPLATIALDNSVVIAQPPTPTTRAMPRRETAAICRPSDRCELMGLTVPVMMRNPVLRPRLSAMRGLQFAAGDCPCAESGPALRPSARRPASALRSSSAPCRLPRARLAYGR